MIAIAGRREQGLSAGSGVCQVLSSVYSDKDVFCVLPCTPKSTATPHQPSVVL